MTRPLLFSCRKATRAISADLDRQLPVGQWLALGMHLALCSACRRYRLQVRGFDRAIRIRLGRPQPAVMTADERQNLLRRLKAG